MNLAILCLLITASNHPEIITIKTTNHTSTSIYVDLDALPEFTSCVTRLIISDKKPSCEYTLHDRKEIYITKSGSINNSPVIIGTPFMINGLRVYPITVYSSYIDNDRLIYYNTIDISIQHDAPARTNSWSRSMYSVYKDLILNLNTLKNILPRGYLIITPNSFADEVQPLADWKEKKGWHVTIATLSQTGRLPANTSSELNTMVAKILGYEKTPYMADTNWYNRALMVAANYPIDTMTTPIATKHWVRENLILSGFSNVDTVFYPPISGPTKI